MSRPCRGNASRITALLTGSLRARAADRLRQHMASCPGCAAAYERLRQTTQLCREIGQQPPPNLSWRKIEAQVHWKLAQQPARRQPWTAWRWLPAVCGLAAAAIVGAIVGGLLFGGSEPRWRSSTDPVVSGMPQHDEELAAVATVAQGEVSVVSSRGQSRRLELPRPLLQGDRVVTGNGRVGLQWAERTGVLLVDSTELELRHLRSATQELVLWQGRVFAHVNRLQPGQRFTVVARGVRVAVKGTHFSVALGSDAVEVEVYSGVVSVGSTDGLRLAVDVPAGQALRVPLGQGPAARSVTRSTPGTAPSLLNLQPWPSFQRVMAESGLLALESTPDSADVRWDSSLVGSTNLVLRGSLGRHLIELYRDGKLLRRQWVDVELSQGRLALDVRPREVARPAARLPAGIHELFSRRRVQIQGCYERRLKHHPTLEGKLTIRLAVDKEGRVARVSLDSDTLVDPKVGQCALGVIQRWQFPAGSEAELVYPFHFRPR